MAGEIGLVICSMGKGAVAKDDVKVVQDEPRSKSRSCTGAAASAARSIAGGGGVLVNDPAKVGSAWSDSSSDAKNPMRYSSPAQEGIKTHS